MQIEKHNSVDSLLLDTHLNFGASIHDNPNHFTPVVTTAEEEAWDQPHRTT